MRAVIISGDAKFGPWIIPQRAQNAVSNAYAVTHGIIVDTFIPEPVFSNLFDTTLWLRKNWDFKAVIICSIFQLPNRDKDITRFIDEMADIEIHFAMEALSGKGKTFLESVFKELSLFLSVEVIEVNSVQSYGDLHKQLLLDRN
jgi:sporadic carbohydrate cluster protein (TIGR04323 family)